MSRKLRKIKRILKILWILYTIISIVFIILEGVIIWSTNFDYDLLVHNYQKCQQENRELKKKVALKNEANGFQNEDCQLNYTTKTTEIIEIYPTVNPEELLPQSTPAAQVNFEQISSYQPAQIVNIYGGYQNEYLGQLKMNNFLSEPLAGSYIPGIAVYESCLPGASRSYRSGYHQGLDFYSYDSGNACTYGTKVMCIADGVIVRIDVGYQEMSNATRNPILDRMAAISADSNRNIETDSEYLELFDLLRGRQVIVDHQNGLFSDYCHLSAVNENLKVGDKIKAGQIIGYLGNSGTSKGSDDMEAGYIIGQEYCQNPSGHQTDMISREWHLHLELWFSPDGLNDELLKTKFVRWDSYQKLFGY